MAAGAKSLTLVPAKMNPDKYRVKSAVNMITPVPGNHITKKEAEDYIDQGIKVTFVEK